MFGTAETGSDGTIVYDALVSGFKIRVTFRLDQRNGWMENLTKNCGKTDSVPMFDTITFIRVPTPNESGSPILSTRTLTL